MEKLDMWQECYCLWCNNDTGDASDNGALQAMTFEEDEDQHGRQVGSGDEDDGNDEGMLKGGQVGR